jgi:hypothetical protein
MMRVRRKKNVYVLRERLIKWDSKFQKQRQSQPGLSPQELEALRLQVNQLQEQVNILSLAWAQFDTRSFTGLRTLGVFLYLVSLPFRWVRRLLALLKSPMFYWTGFYWLCFTRVLIKAGGLKEVLNSLRHPRRLFASIGLFQQ